jgi:hypothetical protein
VLTGDGDEPWRFDEYFVGEASRREPSAAERSANQRRLAQSKPQPWRAYSLAEPAVSPRPRACKPRRWPGVIGLVAVGITILSVVQSGVLQRSLGMHSGILAAASVDAPPPPGDLSSHPFGCSTGSTPGPGRLRIQRPDPGDYAVGELGSVPAHSLRRTT